MNDETILEEARERFDTAEQYYRTMYDKSREWLRFRIGDQWSADARSVRADRPIITSNQIPKYVRQITGDFRKANRRILVEPGDHTGDEEVARINQGLIRHIEQDSDAGSCYNMAVDHAATAGLGFVRVLTRYADARSFDQELHIARVVDPLSVFLDPVASEPLAEDMRWAFIETRMDKKRFEATYPDARSDKSFFDSTLVSGTRERWIQEKTVTICEYFTVEEKYVKLLLLYDGTTVFEPELTDERKAYIKSMAAVAGREPIVATRMSTIRKVMWRKITGMDVLDETEWPGTHGYIPIVPFYGEESWVDGEQHRSGVVRDAADPARLGNYGRSVLAETLALQPKAPWVMAEGQDSGYESMWSSANTQNYTSLVYRPTSYQGQLVPPPQRAQPPSLNPAVLAMIQQSEDDMHGATGIYPAALGGRSNETSGVAITRRQQEADTGTFVYHDNAARSLRHIGKILIDAIPHVYSAQRIIRIVGEDDKSEMVHINQHQQGPDGVLRVLNDLSAGKYSAIVDTGPGYASMREANLDRMMQLLQSFPQAAPVIADIVVDNMNLEEGDRITKRLHALVPPQALAAEQGDDQRPQQQPEIPPEFKQAVQMMEKDLNEAHARIAELEQEVANNRGDNLAKVTVAQINSDAKLAVEHIKNRSSMTSQLLSAMMQPQPQMPYSNEGID